MTKGIIVLGMHRGGTSLVGDLVASWGAYAGGEQELLPADSNNRQGYWEYLPLVRFNQELLAGLSADWFLPPAEADRRTLRKRAAEPSYRGRAEQLIRAMRDGGRSWFWKDPRMALLLPFWQEVLPDVVYVVVVRHPLDIAMSLKKRDHFPVSASLLLWQLHMLSLLRDTQHAPEKIFVRYESLLRHPSEQCERLSAFLERRCEPRRAREEAVSKMVRRVNPDLRHHRSLTTLSDLPEATPEQKALYAFLTDEADDPSARFDETRFAVYAGWREYLLTISALKLMWSHFRGKEHLLLSTLPPTLRQLFGM